MENFLSLDLATRQELLHWQYLHGMEYQPVYWYERILCQVNRIVVSELVDNFLLTNNLYG